MEARIELFDEYFIEVDPLNYTLKQRYKGQDKEGKTKDAERTIGYYPDVKSAVKRFVDLMRLSELDNRHISLQEFVEAIQKADRKVNDFLTERFG